MITLDSEFVMAMLLAGAVCYHLGYRSGVRERLSDVVEEDEEEEEEDEAGCTCWTGKDCRYREEDPGPMREPSHPTTRLPDASVIDMASCRRSSTPGPQ